jgi:hypothetical protein
MAQGVANGSCMRIHLESSRSTSLKAVLVVLVAIVGKSIPMAVTTNVTTIHIQDNTMMMKYRSRGKL